jgi:hypothetical protein
MPALFIPRQNFLGDFAFCVGGRLALRLSRLLKPGGHSASGNRECQASIERSVWSLIGARKRHIEIAKTIRLNKPPDFHPETHYRATPNQTKGGHTNESLCSCRTSFRLDTTCTQSHEYVLNLPPPSFFFLRSYNAPSEFPIQRLPRRTLACTHSPSKRLLHIFL